MRVCRKPRKAAGRQRKSESVAKGWVLRYGTLACHFEREVMKEFLASEPLSFGLMCKGVERQASHSKLTMKSAPFAQALVDETAPAFTRKLVVGQVSHIACRCLLEVSELGED